jgi:hypothetical protein
MKVGGKVSAAVGPGTETEAQAATAYRRRRQVGGLEALGDRLMYPLVANHSVTAGTGVGVRWYELRTSPINGVSLEGLELMSAFEPGCVKTLCFCYDSPVILWGN